MARPTPTVLTPPAMSQSVRPAATVVVLRPRGPDDSNPELYMLRRSSKSAFMPDALVFPGGGVEAEDAENADEDATFARAARREALEEARLAIDLAALQWFDTWQTPSGESPRRFLARFYLTTIEPDRGHDALADGLETAAGRWATASTILEQWAAEQVDLPPPTLCVLLGLADGRAREWSTRTPELLREPILPKVATVADRGGSELHIVMPHDPEYAQLPGEGSSVPARVHGFPRRFVRSGKRWVPQT
jgi:8-oxo-dGTP pyrophosphatase MutT (NUDIX family)